MKGVKWKSEKLGRKLGTKVTGSITFVYGLEKIELKSTRIGTCVSCMKEIIQQELMQKIGETAIDLIRKSLLSKCN